MLLTLAVLALAVMYWFPVRRWTNRWGATPSDLARVMAGDGLLPTWTYSGTLAVVVHAQPENIWSWLVQIGYQRGGLYSYDWLDEPNRALVLDMRNMGGLDWVWQFGLYPVDEEYTQLVSRSRVRARTIWARLLTSMIEPAGFVMTRRMLLGIRERAERQASVAVV